MIVATIGYGGLTRLTELLAAIKVVVTGDFTVVDCRINPVAWTPEFSAPTLRKRLECGQYHCGGDDPFHKSNPPVLNFLGNKGHTREWELAADEGVINAGFEHLATHVDQGTTIVFLCCEKEHGNCHRAAVAKRFTAYLARTRNVTVETVHLRSFQSTLDL